MIYFPPKWEECKEIRERNLTWSSSLTKGSFWKWQNKIGTGCTNEEGNNLALCKRHYVWLKAHSKSRNERNCNKVYNIMKWEFRVMQCSIRIDAWWETFSQDEKKVCVQRNKILQTFTQHLCSCPSSLPVDFAFVFYSSGQALRKLSHLLSH